MYKVAEFCLFMRTMLIHFDLLGGNGNTLNEDDRKIKQQTSLCRHGQRPIANCKRMPPSQPHLFLITDYL
jgi:hypothetical protein